MKMKSDIEIIDELVRQTYEDLDCRKNNILEHRLLEKPGLYVLRTPSGDLEFPKNWSIFNNLSKNITKKSFWLDATNDNDHLLEVLTAAFGHPLATVKIEWIDDRIILKLNREQFGKNAA